VRGARGLDGGVWPGHNSHIIMHSYRHFNHTHTRIGGWDSCERYGIMGIAFRLTIGARLTDLQPVNGRGQWAAKSF